MSLKFDRARFILKTFAAAAFFGVIAVAAPVNLMEGVSPASAQISGGGKVSVIQVAGQPFTEAIHAECPEKKPRSWDVSLIQLTAKEFKKGDAMLFVFYARSLASEAPDGKASFNARAQKASPPWTDAKAQNLKADATWKRFAIPFTAPADYAAGDCKLAFILGDWRQELDVGGIALFDFGNGEDAANELAQALSGAVADAPVSLAPFANMGFKDEVAGDGKGGWSDQGANRDLSLFDPAQTDFGGMSFRIIDPAKHNGKAILVFKSSHLNPAITLSEAALPTPGAKGSILYLLHATAWCGPSGESAGSATVTLKGGGKKTFDIQCVRDVGDWAGGKSMENGAVVAAKRYPAGYHSALFLSRFRFSEVPLEVERVTLKTANASIWLVAGATISSRDLGAVETGFKRPLVIKPHRPINLPPVNPPPAFRIEGGEAVASPAPSTAPVVNPGKGWVAYGNASKQPPEVLALASLGYSRYQWGDLEPAEGKYDWSRIDADLESWSNAGKQYSFGVMNASTHSKAFWASPKWVFDAGAKYRTVELGPNQIETSGIPGPKLAPAFDDPIFLEKLGRFLVALAARYDGHPNLAFIDIRSYGNWGESHMGGLDGPDISAEKYREHLALHRKAFKKSMLSVCCGRDIYADIYPWCVSNGIGMRRDGVCGNSDGSDVLPCAGVLPAVFEFYGSYDFMKARGWWDGKKDGNGNGYRLADCVEIGQATWCDLSRGGNGGLKLLKEEPVLVAELANRLGYHLVLREARYPASAPGTAIPVKVKWENLGVAPMFLPAAVQYALIDGSGRVVAHCAATATKTADLKPALMVDREDRLAFPGAKPGTYSLAVGLVRPGFAEPTVRIAIESKNIGGWQVLGPIQIK
ncbi:MAG: DUF4832 domain-containing protein [Spirochaetes bacterium]|nr:DUF4832 domain-containing protein [Spirochaetota bacterium]